MSPAHTLKWCTMRLSDPVKMMRVRQWYKNLIVFIGLVFSQNAANPQMVYLSVLAFFSFCFVSGGIYVINDIFDVEKDKLHDEKKKRPLPAGRVSKTQAWIFSLVLLTAGFLVSTKTTAEFTYVLAFFLVVGLTYTKVLKNIFLVDAIAIGVNFVLRSVGGMLVISVPLSQWIIISMFLLAMVLVFSKRRMEIVRLKGDAEKHRKVLKDYNNIEFLNAMTIVSLSSFFVAYIIYCITQTHPLMAFTIPVAAFITMRYAYLTYSNNRLVENAENVFFDRHMAGGLCVWFAMTLIILYVL